MARGADVSACKWLLHTALVKAAVNHRILVRIICSRRACDAKRCGVPAPD
jgi:hypothetical protein